jgi:hypothetical protein
MRRLLITLIVALAVAAVAAPTATAARWLAGGGTGGDPASNWTTGGRFSAPVGVVDIYSVCSPYGAYTYTIYARRDNLPGSVSQGYTLPCDGRGRWLRRVGIPRNTWLDVHAVAKDRVGIPCLHSDHTVVRCATGYTSVWSSW